MKSLVFALSLSTTSCSAIGFSVGAAIPTSAPASTLQAASSCQTDDDCPRDTSCSESVCSRHKDLRFVGLGVGIAFDVAATVALVWVVASVSRNFGGGNWLGY